MTKTYTATIPRTTTAITIKHEAPRAMRVTFDLEGLTPKDEQRNLGLMEKRLTLTIERND